MLDSQLPLGLLRLPEQKDASASSLDLRPRNMEQWISALPRADVGETARLVYKGLHEFNRTRLPDADRFRIAEMFREPVAFLTNALRKHYIGIAIPLTRKKQKIALLVRELQAEMAIAYKIIVEGKLMAGAARSDNKALTQALHRSLRYLSLTLLRSYQIYVPVPSNIWKEIHRLYLYAQENDLHQTLVKDQVGERPADSNIADLYKQIVILSLAGPYRLRQSEIDTLYDILAQWGSYVELHEISDPDQQMGMCSLNLNSDEPPGYLALCSDPSIGYCRVLDTSRLVDFVSENVANGTDVYAPGALARTNKLSVDVLRRLLFTWGGMAKRNFSRTARNSKIRVTIGLNSIHHFIYDALRTQNEAHAEGTEPVVLPLATDLTLEPLGKSGTGFPNSGATKSRFSSKEVFETHQHGKPGKDVWNPLFNIPTPDYQSGEIKYVDDATTTPPFEFHVCTSLNESAGGFCLLWMPVEISQNPLNALVGELVGMQELTETNKGRWSVGVVRWMKSPDGQQLELGVQRLAPYAIAAQIRNERGKNKTDFLRSLVLPELKTVDLPVTLITPTLFEAGHMLTLNTGSEKKPVRLTKLLESTGAFSHFEFKEWKKAAPRKPRDEESEDSKWNFDNLWSSL